ncbi:MAG: hypothetical protein ACFFDT_21130 [Candidatus Hodarchaeota archaeon]
MFHYFFFSWPAEPWDQLIIGSLEPYFDYKYYYRKFAEEFIRGNWFPYVSEVSDQILDSYVYPPLFLYVISIPALLDVNLVFVPLFLADISLPIVIYRFLEYSNGQEVAQWGFFTVLFCPLSIVYNGGFLFNTSLVVLAFIISMYFINVKRFKYAVLTLSISFLLKQIILFFILPIFIYIIFKSTENGATPSSYLKNIIVYGVILIGTIFIGSLPWILITPHRYFETVFMSQQATFNPSFISRELTWPVQWYSFLIDLKAPYWFLYITAFLNFTMLGVISLQVINFILLKYWHRKNSLDWYKLLDLVVYTAILSHLFLPRGVYKYYFTLHVPLIILWICFHFRFSLASSPAQQKKVFIIFFTACLALLLLHRLLYLLLIWVIFFFMLLSDLNFIFQRFKRKLSSAESQF